MSRSFTPAQANRTLPLVRKIVEDILITGRATRQLGAAKSSPDNHRQLEELGQRMHELLSELTAIGCEYKGWSFDLGLIDFPGEIEGRAVLLCWRSDEASVAWYHTAEAGFAGRQRIPDHLLADPISAASGRV